MKVHEKLYIGGEWMDPATDAVISPHTEEVVGRVPEASTDDVDRAVATARAAFDDGEWPRTTPEERIEAVQRFAEAYAARIPEMAAIITEEMGSPITFSNLGQSAASWMILNTFAGIAAQFPWEDTRTGMLGTDVIVRHEPVGVVAGIVPWNVPQFVTIAKLAPALLAGCTIILKPAPETPLDAYLMAEILDEAGIPKGVVFDPARRPRSRRTPRAAHGNRQGRVHRINCCRASHRRHLRRAAQAREPRARRQVGGHHPRRRRSREPAHPRLGSKSLLFQLGSAPNAHAQAVRPGE